MLSFIKAFFASLKKLLMLLMRAATPHGVFFGAIVFGLVLYTVYIGVFPETPLSLIVAIQIAALLSVSVMSVRRVRARQALAALASTGLGITEESFHQGMEYYFPGLVFRLFEVGIILSLTCYAWFVHTALIPTFIVAASALLCLLIFTAAFAPIAIFTILAVNVVVALNHADEIRASPVYLVFLVLAGLLSTLAVKKLGVSLLRTDRGETDMFLAIQLVFDIVIVAVVVLLAMFCDPLGLDCSSVTGASVILATIFSYLVTGRVENHTLVKRPDFPFVSMTTMSPSPWNITNFLWCISPLCSIISCMALIGPFSVDLLAPFAVFYSFVIIGLFRQKQKQSMALQHQVQVPPEVFINAFDEPLLGEPLLGPGHNRNQ